MKNENELFTLLDKFCELSIHISIEKLHQIIFLLGYKQENESVTKWMRQHWEEDFADSDEVNYDRVFERMKQQMVEVPTNDCRRSTHKRLSFMQVLYRSAAVLLLPLLGLSIYFIVQNITLKSAPRNEIVEILDKQGMQSRITLADGSIVTLKEGSRLNQNDNFNGSTREITLEGEAFVEIAHNPNKPFIIHTGSVKTTALGTSFSIKAVPGETSITVGVVEGKVKIEEGEKLLATLGANQQFKHGIEVEHRQEQAINAEYGINWQPHDLIFSNMSFGDIAQDLAVRYGVDILFENESLKQKRIDALLDNRNSIDILLRLLCTTQQATYTVKRNTYVIQTKK